jgi:hypothetical protein
MKLADLIFVVAPAMHDLERSRIELDWLAGKMGEPGRRLSHPTPAMVRRPPVASAGRLPIAAASGL